MSLLLLYKLAPFSTTSYAHTNLVAIPIAVSKKPATYQHRFLRLRFPSFSSIFVARYMIS